MEVSISLNFKIHAVNGRYYIQLFNEYVKFEPKLILYKQIGKKWKQSNWNKSKHLKFIESFNEYDNLIVGFNGGEGFSSNETGSETPHRSISISQNDTLENYNEIDLIKHIDMPGFVSAYIYSSDYERVQSTQFASNLKGLNISKEVLATIRNTPYRIEYGTGFKIYDTKHNPGRSELIGYTWLMPAWKMWFGKGFYHLVSKEKILSFPNAFEIKELDNDIVYVHLFEKIEESWTKENMHKQQAWRDWLDFDKLVEQYP